MGAILAPGRRTVSSALRAMGLDQEKRFHRYHRVLSRAQLVEPGGESRPVGAAPRGVRPEGRTTDPRRRRDAGATLRQEDLSQGRLP